MLPTVKVYSTEQQARGVVAKLVERGFAESDLVVLTPGFDADTAVKAAIDDERLPFDYGQVCRDQLQQGKSIVGVEEPFGRGQAIVNVLNSGDPLDIEMPEIRRQSPAPLSDFLGLPLLSGKAPTTRMISFDNQRSFGYRLLSSNPAPLSALFRMPLLKGGPGNTSFGFPLLKKGPGNTSFGFPLLTKRRSA